MHISLVILTPILICIWIYVLLLVRHCFISNNSTSIEVNIIDADQVVSGFKTKANDSGCSGKNENEKRKKKLVHVPKFMLELYEKNKIGRRSKERPDVVRSLIPSHAGLFPNNEILQKLSNNHLLVFDLPELNKDEVFIGAELKILTLLELNTNDENGVKRILKIFVYDNTVQNLLHYQEIHIHHSNNTWMSFDVTAPVNEILQTDTRNKSLKIVISVNAYFPHISNNLKLSLMPIEEDIEHDYPVLLLSYSSAKKETDIGKDIPNNVGGGANRRKRSLEDDYEEETNRLWDDEFSNKKTQVKKLRRIRNTCKKRPLYIDFAEINYDSWIVQPSGYEAYQCQGRCFYPVADHLNPTKHAIVQALLHSMAPSKATRSCCVPTILDSISILYVDNNGVLTYRYAYKDMVVSECGCR